MTSRLLLACLAFSLSLGFGQMLFKLAANDIKVRVQASLFSAAFSPWLIAAIILYALSTLLWVGILTQVPLTRAYPFALLGAAIVPVLGMAVLGESLSPYYPLGMALVVIGVAIIQLN